MTMIMNINNDDELQMTEILRLNCIYYCKNLITYIIIIVIQFVILTDLNYQTNISI